MWQMTSAFSGYYTAAATIAKVPYYALFSVSAVLFPFVSGYTHRADAESAIKYIRAALRFSLLVLSLLCAILLSTSREIIALLYSAVYLSSVSAMGILVLGSAFFSLFMVISTAIAASGKPSLSAIIGGFMLAAEVIFSIAFIPRYGINGAAMAVGMASFLAFTSIALVARRRFNNWLFRPLSVVRVLLAGVVVFIASLLVPVGGMMLLPKYAVLSALYIAILFVLGEIGKDDWAMFVRLAIKPFGRKRQGKAVDLPA